jgi:hypothetical protein
MAKCRTLEPLHTPDVLTCVCTPARKRTGSDLEDPSSVPVELSSNTEDRRSGYRNYGSIHDLYTYIVTVPFLCYLN